MADVITLRLIQFPNGSHAYYHRLLTESLQAAGHTVRIIGTEHLPQPRVAKYLETGQLTLVWYLQTAQRDAQYVRVNHTLTQGLIGHRVLLIPAGDEAHYARVGNLADLQALHRVAGMGAQWFDVKVWRENGLDVWEQPGDWQHLYAMVAGRNRGIDYMPRGATEILAEARDQPKLAIEPRLLLVYPRDFVFYLARSEAALKPVIERALAQAEKSGLQKRLLEEYFGPAVTTLNLDKRIRIPLRDVQDN